MKLVTEDTGNEVGIGSLLVTDDGVEYVLEGITFPDSISRLGHVHLSAKDGSESTFWPSKFNLLWSN